MEQKEILTAYQKKAIELVVGESKLAAFYLSGGTALAGVYLHHRFFDDLDFFSFDPLDGQFLHSFINTVKKKLGARSVRYERIFDRNLFFLKLKGEELKIEFTQYPFKQLSMVELWRGARVDSLMDIAANKLMALLDRFDPKDFVDLYFLLQQFSLEKIKKDAEKKFGIKIDNLFLGSELAKAQRIKALPIMVRPLTVDELKVFFIELSRKVGEHLLE